MNTIGLEQAVTEPTGEEIPRLQSLQGGQVLARFDRLMTRMERHNAAISEEEVAANVAAARAELDA